MPFTTRPTEKPNLRPLAMLAVLALAAGGCFSAAEGPFADETGGSTGDETDATTGAGTESSGGSTTETTANPSTTAGPSTTDATTDGSSTDSPSTDAGPDETGTGDASTSESGDPNSVCAAGEVLACDGDVLVTCNDDGTAEQQSTCVLGCNDDELRCNDVDPSNALGEFLDGAADEPDFDLGDSATISTTTGVVTVGGEEIAITSSVVDGAPPIRVFVVGSLLTGDVAVDGTNALAIVSDGEIRISGHFSASAYYGTPGPGVLNNPACQGEAGELEPQTVSGAGGGGFGSPGGSGGSATNQGTAQGGAGGGTTGNATLIPLRGGCDSGAHGSNLRGRGGGAVQLVSRTEILIEGVLSANGSSRSGGGSGGGVLLEAPIVDVSGNAVANGGAGAGGGFLPIAGEDGGIDAQPSAGGPGADTNCSNGGNGAGGTFGAQSGQNISQPNLVFAGHGGGGRGRIRINTPADGFTGEGILSPNPTTGDLGIR